MKIQEENQLKYHQIEEDIKRKILRGEISPGEKILSENKMADKYHVSRQTVRKALFNLEKDGFIYAIHGSGTYCSDGSRSKYRSRNIAVVMTYLSDYIFPKVINGIDSVLSENDYSIILKHTNNSRGREVQCLEEILKKNIDGVIIEPSKSNMFCRHKELYDRLDEYGIPYIFIQGSYSIMEDKAHVLLDDEEGEYLLTKYLIELGHREIIGVFKCDDSQGQNRHKGFVKAFVEAGIPYNPENVIWFYTEDRAIHPYDDIMKMIKSGKRIDAIAAYNDQVAMHILKALRKQGLKVPDDISITGYDNSQMATSTGIRLTTVVHPQEELGRLSAEMLLKMINGERVEKRVIIQPELIIGNSCRARNV